ncbi:MAG TPA: prepilin-type N-terminal cleavage/methylation domain-containing protein [Thermoleophilaceae bacterium]|jgi:prepilin-type N-terminal cleavage/methylation domain-containing protein
MERVRRRPSGQSGFTLIELLSGMMIGLIVLMAAFTLIDHATSASEAIANRQDAVQRGRMAMERVTRQLRSQVCLGEETEPITAGDANSVTFFADLSDGSKNVQQRVLTFSPTAKTITEQSWPGVGTYPQLTFPGPPNPPNVLLRQAQQVTVNGVPQPIFRFFAFKVGGVAGDMEELPVPLSPTDASRTIMVKVSFVALPDRIRPKDLESTTFFSDVYVRLADPTKPAEGPRCL